jgi:hypothetical protein
MMIRALHIDEIGGARARQAFSSGGRTIRRGEEIPLDALRSWPTLNRNVMIEKGYIEVWPRSVAFLRQEITAPAAPEQLEDDDDARQLIKVPRGFGKFDVIEGRYVAESVSSDEADAIMGAPKIGREKPIFRKNNPRSRAWATAPEPKMPMGIKPADEEPNGPVE